MFPGPRPASRHLQYGKAGEGLVHFLTWVTSHTGERGCHVNHKQLWPHAQPRARVFRVERWQRTKMLLCRSPRDSREDREFLPSQDSEDIHQQFSRARPDSIKVFLPPFYPWCHSCEKMYQALSRFTVLEVTGSWAGAWERGYIYSIGIGWHKWANFIVAKTMSLRCFGSRASVSHKMWLMKALDWQTVTDWLTDCNWRRLLSRNVSSSSLLQ